MPLVALAILALIPLPAAAPTGPAAADLQIPLALSAEEPTNITPEPPEDERVPRTAWLTGGLLLVAAAGAVLANRMTGRRRP